MFVLHSRRLRKPVAARKTIPQPKPQPRVRSMPTPPIIIIKKKAGHGGHHGGAWKVAYADFVTAMMALFIVLWLLNSSKKIQEAVGGYFRNPNGSAQNAGTNLNGTGVAVPISKDDMPKLKEEL